MSYEEQRRQYLEQKYRMTQLVLDKRPDAKERTLQDFVDQSDREAMKGLKLALGSTIYKNQPLNIWFTIG